MPGSLHERAAQRVTRGYSSDVDACGKSGHREPDDSIVTSVVATDPDDLLTARPTDDATIDDFGRRVALIPDELGDRWPNEFALDV
jgi:hypothetical protein